MAPTKGPSELKQIINKKSIVFSLIAILLFSLFILGKSLHGVEQFNRIYLWLFGASILAVFVLAIIIIQRLVWLYLKHKNKEAGIKLTTRMVTIFVSLSLPPILIVYFFSTQFLNNYIDSWFDTKTDQALNDSLKLGKIFLDVQTKQALDQTKGIAQKLSEIDDHRQAIYLESFLDESNASSLSLISTGKNLLERVSNELIDLTTDMPPQAAYRTLRTGDNFTRIETKPTSNELQIRILVKIKNVLKVSSNHRYLQGLFSIQKDYSGLAYNIEESAILYNQQKYQREQLKNSYNIILALVIMIIMLLALLWAFSASKKFIAPLRLLFKATERITDGDYGQTIPVTSNDEIGFLVKSFNSMSSQLASSSALAHRAQSEAISQKWYLENILSHLSSGVLSIDNDQRVQMANAAAIKILNLTEKHIINQNIQHIGLQNPGLAPLVELIITKLDDHNEAWQQETLITEKELRKILVVRGSRIPDNKQNDGGMVVIFDDQTIINQAQRDAAWSEVARRLAHEVKNPLTPIQLSAERLRLRFLSKLPEEDKDVLDRATQTIVSQVDNLKTLVNAFSDYAKAPELKREPRGLNQLIKEAVDLYYMSHAGINFKLDFIDPEPILFIDKVRFSQLLTNLIKNSSESAVGNALKIHIETFVCEKSSNQLTLKFSDNGPGFKTDILEHIFEPYETTKKTGSGLGLAIVKKIVEEHGGSIMAYNDSGAIIEVNLPIYQK